MDWPTWLNSLCLGALLVGCGALGYNYRLLRKVERDQRGIDKTQREIEVHLEAVQKEIAGGLGRMTSNWRDLPPEGRQALRAAMLQVVAEIDAEPPATRH